MKTHGPEQEKRVCKCPCTGIACWYRTNAPGVKVRCAAFTPKRFIFTAKHELWLMLYAGFAVSLSAGILRPVQPCRYFLFMPNPNCTGAGTSGQTFTGRPISMKGGMRKNPKPYRGSSCETRTRIASLKGM